jgi:hypothetical protein
MDTAESQPPTSGDDAAYQQAPDVDLPVRGPPPPLEAWTIEDSEGEPLSLALSGDGVTHVLTRQVRKVSEVPRVYSVTLRLLAFRRSGSWQREQTFDYLHHSLDREERGNPPPGWGWMLRPLERGVLVVMRGKEEQKNFSADLGCGELRSNGLIRLDEHGQCLWQYPIERTPGEIKSEPVLEGRTLVRTWYEHADEGMPTLKRLGADGAVLMTDQGDGRGITRFGSFNPLADGTTLASGDKSADLRWGTVARLDEEFRPLWEVPLPEHFWNWEVAAAPDGTSLTVLRSLPREKPLRWGATVLPPASGHGWLLLRTAPDGTPRGAVESWDTGKRWREGWAVASDTEGVVMVRDDAAGVLTLEARDWKGQREWSQPLEIPGQPSLQVKKVWEMRVNPEGGVRLLVSVGSKASEGAPTRLLILATRRR